MTRSINAQALPERRARRALPRPGASSESVDEVDITIWKELDYATIDDLWPRYERAFAPLRTKAATRMVMHRSEFEQQLQDPRVLKYLARHNGEAVGLATLAVDLHAIEWISPDYYAHRFPDRFRRGRVYYLGWMYVEPEYRRHGLWQRLLQFGAEKVIADDAMIVYDTCRFNEDAIDFTGSVNRMLAGLQLGQIGQIDQQLYYAWVPFSATA